MNQLIISDIDNILPFFNSLKPATKVKINSTNPLYNTTAFFLTKTKDNLVVLMSGSNKYLINLNTLSENPYGITSFDLIDRSKPAVEPTTIIEMATRPLEGGIIEEGVEVQQEEFIQEISQWQRIYSIEDMKESLINSLLELEPPSKRDTVTTYDRVRKTSNNFIRMILDYQKIQDEKEQFDVKRKGDNYKPQLETVLNGYFDQSLITPIVYDRKKYYTDNLKLLEPTDESIQYKDFVFLNFDEELEIISQLYNLYYKSNKKNGDYKNYKELMEYLYNGGHLHYFTDENEEVDIHIKPINRPFVDGEEPDKTFYGLKVNDSYFVIRHCNPEQTCLAYPDIEPSKQKPVKLSTRQANGNLQLFYDKYEEKLISDSKGKHGKIRTCSGTNKASDASYYSGDKNDLFNHITNRPPETKTIVEGEELMLIGFLVKSRSNYQLKLWNNYVEHRNKSDTKIYQPVNNLGINLIDIIRQNNTNREHPSKEEEDIIENNDLLEETKAFDYTKIDIDSNTFILFDTSKKHKLTTEEYHDILETILPSIKDICKKELKNIELAENFNGINAIFNKYNLSLFDFTKSLMMKTQIKKHLITKIMEWQRYDRYLFSIYKMRRNNYIDFGDLYKTILTIKANVENTLFSGKPLATYSSTLDTLRLAFTKQLTDFLITRPTEYLEEFIINYLGLLPNETIDRPELISMIVDLFYYQYPSFPFQNSLVKYIILRNDYIPSSYLTLINRYFELNNIELLEPSKPFTMEQNFYSMVLTDLLEKLAKTKDNGDIFFDILNLFDNEEYSNFVNTIILDYAKDQFLQENKDGDWDSLTETEKSNYVPSIETLKTYREKVSGLKEEYLEAKKKYDYYLQKCSGIKIVKTYHNINELLDDNNKIIYWSSTIDHTAKDMAILREKGEEYLADELRKLPRYMFDSDTDIERLAGYYIELNKEENPVLKHRVLDNEKALLSTEKGRTIYIRKDNVWIQDTVEIGHEAFDGCFHFTNDLLRMDTEEIIRVLGEPINKDKSDELCVAYGNYRIPKPLIEYVFNYEYYSTLISNIGKIVSFMNDNSRFSSGKLKDIKERLELLELKNQRDLRKKNLLAKQYEIEPFKRILPPKNLWEEFNEIRRISDFDIRYTTLKMFIDRHSIPYRLYEDKTGLVSETNPITAKWLYWNNSRVNFPMICKHHLDLYEMAWKDNNTRFQLLNEINQKWTTTIKERKVCNNCGETLDFIEYSDFEGFSGDKVVRVREVIKESEEVGELKEEYDLTENENRYKLILNIITKALGVNLTRKDLKLLLKTVSDRQGTEISLNQFYFTWLANSEIDQVKKIRDKPEFIRGRELFMSKYGVISLETIKNALMDETSLPSMKFFVETFKSRKGTSTTELTDKPFYIIYQYYLNVKKMIDVIGVLLAVLVISIPDYIFTGSGSERKTKGKLIGDFYSNPENGFNVLSFYTRNIIQSNNTKFWVDIKGYYNLFKGTPMEDLIKNEIKSVYGEVMALSEFQDLFEKKKEYRLDIELLFTFDAEKGYTWKEFLPNLHIPADYEYEIPDIDSYISNYKTLWQRVELKQNTLGLKDLSEITEAELDDLLGDIKSMETINKQLEEVSRKSSALLMTKLGNIVNNQNINVKLSAYTAICCYNNLNSSYYDFFISQDLSISSIRDTLLKIEEVFTNFPIKLLNGVIGVPHSNKFQRMLMDYMYFDPRYYKNNDSLIRDYLIKKIKQINFIVVISGELKGTPRLFKLIKDPDRVLIDKVNSLNPEANQQEKAELLYSVLRRKYPNMGKDFYDRKVENIMKAEGRDFRDINTNEYLSDIVKSLEIYLKDKTTDDLLAIILDFQKYSSLKNKLYKNPLALINDIEKIDRDQIAIDRLDYLWEKMVEWYPPIKDLGNLLDLTKIQNEISQLSTISELKFSELQSEIGSNYEFINKLQIGDKAGIINMVVGTDKYDKATITEILNNIGGNQNIMNELKGGILEQLKVEGIEDPIVIPIEDRLRKAIYTQQYHSTTILNLKGIIQSILVIVSLIKNKKRVVVSEKLPKSLDKLEREILKNTIEIQETLLTNGFIDLLIENDISLFSDIDLTLYNNLLEALSICEDNYNALGLMEKVFVNNAKYLIEVAKLVIFNLLKLIVDYIDSIEEEKVTIIEGLKQILLYIVENFEKISYINNTTNQDVANEIKQFYADENAKRKKKFENMTQEQKDLHRLVRGFNLGRLFETSEDMIGQDIERKVENLMVEGVEDNEVVNQEALETHLANQGIDLDQHQNNLRMLEEVEKDTRMLLDEDDDEAGEDYEPEY
jgi:hypothetical protein